MKIKSKQLDIAAFFVLILMAVICMVTIVRKNSQATMPTPMPLDFVGEYSYDGENWAVVDEKVPMSALSGNLYLKGHFDKTISEGMALYFFKNHIGVEIWVNGERQYLDIIAELSELGIETMPSMCGKEWDIVMLSEITTQDTVEIKLLNKHSYGNSTAYNDFLRTLSGGPVDDFILSSVLKTYSQPFRFIGGLTFVLSLIIIGCAIAAYALRTADSTYILKIGLLTLFVSGFVTFDTIDSFFWNEYMALPTYIIQFCMMFSVHCVGWIACDFLTGKRQIFARILVILSEILIFFLTALALSGTMLIYDTGFYWMAFQLVFCAVMVVFCIIEYVYNENRDTLMLVSAAVLFATTLMDIIAIGTTMITGAVCSKSAFYILLVVHIISVSKDIIRNRQASALAEKLKKELEDSRISIMLSQIQPHFLYNAISAIQVLCGRQPLKAKEALGEFALYLRGNIDSLSSNTPIPFYKELQHVESYLALEKMRFEDELNIVYDIQEQDFFIPSLTLQPLVENAVKHGIFAREEGGTVTIKTYTQGDSIIVSVTDDGVGFDENNKPKDDRLHIGIKNVKSRLEKMVDGQLEISSVVDKGTTARIILKR